LNLSLEDVIAERYAQISGRSKEEAKAILNMMKEKQPDRYERLSSILGVLSEYGDKIKDPILLSVLRPILTEEMSQVKSEDDPFGLKQAVKTVGKYVTALKTFDAMLPGISAKPSDAVMERINKVEEKVSNLLEELKGEKEKTLVNALTTLQNEIASIKGELEELKKTPPKKEEPITADKIVEEIQKREKEARKFLELRGYKIEKGLSRDEIIKLAEEKGFKVIETTIPLERFEKFKEEVEKKMEQVAQQAYQKGKEEARKEFDEKMYEKQINALKDIISNVVDRLVGDIFGPVIQGYLGGKISGTGEKSVPKSGKTGK